MEETLSSYETGEDAGAIVVAWAALKPWSQTTPPTSPSVPLRAHLTSVLLAETTDAHVNAVCSDQIRAWAPVTIGETAVMR